MSRSGGTTRQSGIDAHRSLREQAAVLAWFSESWLRAPDDGEPDEIVLTDFLMDDCLRVPGPDGLARWMLKDDVRRRTLRQMGADGARQRLASVATTPSNDPVQEAIGRALGAAPAPQEHTRSTISADLHAARWLRGVVANLPEERALQSALARLELLAPFTALLAGGFYGREEWLQRLGRHLNEDGGRFLVISGVGGIGKSTLLAKFLTDALAATPQMRFAYLNFDRGALAANRPAILLAEVLKQVVTQVPELAGEANPLIEDLSTQEHFDWQAGGYSSREVSQTVGTHSSFQLIAAAVPLLERAAPFRLLLVLDTFEEVQRQRITNLHVLWELLGTLRSELPGLRVVVSGRALDGVSDGFPSADIAPLEELDFDAAVRMVMDATDVEVTADTARRTVELVSGNPLSLRLAVDILRRSHHADPLLDLELQEGQVQGQLYNRILMHIEDPLVRRLAHPGLVVRAVTPAVIRHILAKPCGIAVPNDEVARRLFEALWAEATLVAHDRGVLRHRNDVRSLMLPTLQRDQRPVVNRIHRAAVRYYGALEGPENRAEELYHRLMLEQSERTLDERWDPAVLGSLLESIDEFPATSQVYLWSRSGGAIALDAEVTRLADDRGWARATQPTAVAELRAGRPEVALELVTARRGRAGESLLPSVEVEALEEMGQLDAALEVLTDARRAALHQRRPADAVALTMDLMRVLERLGRFEDALAEARELAESLARRTGESALDYLAATTSRLRLLRRSGQEGSEEATMAGQEAIRVAESLPYRLLSSRPGLLRELLAEIGTRDTDLLRFGIETVGVARGKSRRLDERLDEQIDPAEAPEGAPPDAEPEDVAVTVETRGRLAKKLATYVDEAGGLDEDLSEAVAESYQTETDELYS